MTLVPQSHSIPLALGIDTKNNPVLVDENKWVLIQNGNFSKGSLGQIHTRNGYKALTTAISGSSSQITAGTALAQLGSELDQFAEGSLYGLSPSQNAWVQKAFVTPLQPSVEAIVKNGYNQSLPDAATLSNVTVYAWVDSRSGNPGQGVWLKVVDQENGTVLYPETQLDASGINPRVVVNGTTIAVLWIAGSGTGSGNIVGVTINPASPASGPSSRANTTIAAGSGGGFEVVTLGSNFGIAWGTYVGTVHASLIAVGTLAFGSTVNLYSGNNIIAIAGTVIGNGNFVVAGYDNSGENRVWFLNPANLSTVANFSSAGASTSISNLVLVADSGTATNVFLFDSFPPGGGADRFVEIYPFDQSGGAGLASVFKRSVGIVSQPFVQAGATYVLASYQSSVQQTYFLLVAEGTGTGMPTGSIVGRFMALDAGPVPAAASNLTVAFNAPAHVLALASGVFALPVAEQDTLVSAGGKAATLDGISLLTLDFTKTQVRTAQLGSDLTIAGGLPQLYDGSYVFENGFNVFPEAPTLAILTSQIGFTGFSWIPATTTGNVTVTFPKNPDGSGFDGRLITAGEYLMDLAGDLVWFSVDGLGSQPTAPGGGVTPQQCSISSADSAAVIATKFATAWNLNSSSWVASAVGNVVTLAATNALSGGFVLLSRQFNIVETLKGNGSTQFDTMVCNGIAGKFIQPGQYFTFVVNDGINNRYYYVWFTVDGVGTDPQVFTGTYAVPINCSIASTDAEDVVAGKIASAVNGGGYAAANVAFGITVEIVSGNAAAAGTGVSLGNLGRALGTFGAVTSGQFDSYEMCAMYEAVDTQGQLHRSAPSVATQVQFPAYGIGNAVVQITYVNLRLTARPSVDVALYSTIADGTNFYRLTSETSLIPNIPTQDFSTYVDAVTDATLQGNELLYTTGGVVPNNCPPAFAQVVNFQDRLWLQDAEDLQLWWYSKDFSNGVAVEFSVAQTMRFDPVNGPTVAAIVMDSGLMVFAANGIWLVNGFGPDAAGNGAPFNGPNEITTPVGLRDADSLVLIPSGVMFKTTKGFYLIDRGLSVAQQGINGNAVDAYAADVVVSAELVPGNTEVRFLAASGTTLSYDWQFQQWSPFTDHNGVDSIVFEGNYYYLQSSALVLEEAAGYYLDNATGFSLVGQTAWLRLSGIQGFQNLFKSLWQGFFPGTNEVQFQIAYDYNPAIVDTFILNTGAAPTNQTLVFPGLGSNHNYSKTLTAPVVPGSVVLKIQGGATLAQDDGNGHLVAVGGATISAGSITYSTGVTTWHDSTARTSVNLELDYQSSNSFPDVTQLRVFNSIMPCEAVQFTVQLLGPFWQSTKALALNAVELEVGVYRGAFRNLGPPVSLG